jgi:hypothetical protein
MFEVYTGTKVGRPTVLLLLTAAALLGALGLAWTQVRGALALGEETAIAGTPLTVRPPEGWRQDPRNPRVFGKWVRKRVWGREVWAAERKLDFRCNDYFAQLARLFQAAAASPGQPARIGGFDGVQFLLGRPGLQPGDQTVYRWASTSGGDQVSIEYTPLAEVSHGDLDLMDAICEAVQLRDSNVPRPPQRILDNVGISFPRAPDWQVVGAENQNGPGLWVQSVVEDRPVWAMAVFRRGLPRENRPADLLWAESRQLFRSPLRPQQARRDDGTYVAVMQNPASARTGSVVVSVWVVARSPLEAAVIYVLADPLHAEAANSAARELAGTIEFTAEYPR